jgi:hypothetical protein
MHSNEWKNVENNSVPTTSANSGKKTDNSRLTLQKPMKNLQFPHITVAICNCKIASRFHRVLTKVCDTQNHWVESYI